MAKKEEAFEVEGTVMQALANTRFRVQLETGDEVLAHVAGKMRKNFIRIVPATKSESSFPPTILLKVESSFANDNGSFPLAHIYRRGVVVRAVTFVYTSISRQTQS